MAAPTVSLIIPAYNEEHRLPATINTIRKHLHKQKINYELIVVDDGSKDATPHIVKAIKDSRVRLATIGKNRGKGYAVKFGMQVAKGKWIVFTDADLSTPIEELDHFLKLVETDTILIGSRNLSASDIQVKQPWFRKVPGKVFSLLTRLLIMPGIKDSQCGFKLYPNKAAKAMVKRQQINGFGFDLEHLFIAKRQGFAIKEIPIVWRNDGQSKVHIIKDAADMFMSIFRIRLNDLAGRYD